MAELYDLMLLLDPSAADDQRAKIVADAEAAIGSAGTLVGKHDWGRRAMAYEVDHQTDAEYHLLQFEGPPALLERLQQTLRVTDGVTRFRIIKVAPGTPDPPHVRPEPRREPPDTSGATEPSGEAVAEAAGS